jgi:hypothetical protein
MICGLVGEAAGRRLVHLPQLAAYTRKMAFRHPGLVNVAEDSVWQLLASREMCYIAAVWSALREKTCCCDEAAAHIRLAEHVRH